MNHLQASSEARTNAQPAAYPPEPQPHVIQTPEEKADEAARIQQLQRMMHRVMQVLEQNRSLPVERASALVADARRAALAMFPDKAQAFDILYWPRLQRLMRERYRMQ